MILNLAAVLNIVHCKMQTTTSYSLPTTT